MAQRWFRVRFVLVPGKRKPPGPLKKSAGPAGC